MKRRHLEQQLCDQVKRPRRPGKGIAGLGEVAGVLLLRETLASSGYVGDPTARGACMRLETSAACPCRMHC